MNRQESINNIKVVYKEWFKSLTDMFELLIRKENFSNYADMSIQEQYKTFADEVTELQTELESEIVDPNKVQKELADVIYTLLMNMGKMYELGLIDWEWLKSFWKIQSEKIYQRSPFLKEWYKPSHEEENKIWYETKARLAASIANTITSVNKLD